MSGGGGDGGDGRGGGTQRRGNQAGVQVETVTSPLSADGNYMSPLHAADPLANPLNQPSPDQYGSAGFFGFGRRRAGR